MSEQPYVLVVDDEPFNFDIIELAIGENCRLDYVSDGEQALRRVEEHAPDVVLLDIRMPGMDGYEVCERLKERVDAPVIFVSALDSLEERMAGYDAGGSDYITKPFAADELQRKVNIAIRYREERSDLLSQASSAMNTAMVAIASAGELGVVLQFLGKSFKCGSYEELATEVLEAMEGYALECAVQVRAGGEVVNLACGAVVSPLEIAVLDRMRDQRRILDFGSRTVINYPRISLLIKNMPLDDGEAYGRIKDNVALLVEEAESRARSMEVEAEARRRKLALEVLMSRTEEALRKINERQREHKQASARIMEELLEKIEASFAYLGLDETQEESLLAMANQAVEQTLALYDEGLAVDQHLGSLVETLQRTLRAH